jgi:uncharacterized protein YqkB
MCMHRAIARIMIAETGATAMKNIAMMVTGAENAGMKTVTIMEKNMAVVTTKDTAKVMATDIMTIKYRPSTS